MNDSIAPEQLEQLLASNEAPRVLDVRLAKDRVPVDHPVPGAEWRDPEKVAEWSSELSDRDDIVVYCVHGHHVSRAARDRLCKLGLRVRVLEGGITAWCEHLHHRAPDA